jgi:hypothetical protein
MRRNYYRTSSLGLRSLKQFLMINLRFQLGYIGWQWLSLRQGILSLAREKEPVELPHNALVEDRRETTRQQVGTLGQIKQS